MYSLVATTETKVEPSRDPKQSRGFPGISPGAWLNIIVFVLAVSFTFLFGELELNMQYAFKPKVLVWINLGIFVLIGLFCVIMLFQMWYGGPVIVGYPKQRVYDPLHLFIPFVGLAFMLLSYAYLVAKQLALIQHYSGYIDDWDKFKVNNMSVKYESMHRVFADAQHGFTIQLSIFTVWLLVIFFFDRHPFYSKGMRQVELLQRNQIQLSQFEANMQLFEPVK